MGGYLIIYKRGSDVINNFVHVVLFANEMVVNCDDLPDVFLLLVAKV